MRGVETGHGSEPSGTIASSSADSRNRKFFGLYLLFVAAYSIRTGLEQAQSKNSWVIGDWLINYSGGFVRRGLTGEVALLLHRVVGVPLEWVIFTFQASVFLVFLGCVYRLTKGIRWSYWMVAVLVSPATLAFTVLDQIGFRKEFLLLAALGLTIWALVAGRWKDWQISGMLSVLLVGLTLSHEGMLVAAPYFVVAVVIQTKSLRRAGRICAIPLGLMGIALVAVILHHGDLREAEAICRSVGGEMARPGVVLDQGGVCTGAIAAMQLNVVAEHASVEASMHAHPVVRLFALLVLPVFLPLVVLMAQFYRRDRLRHEVMTVVGCALVSLPGIAVLFYVGRDWGRWLHLEAVTLMLLALMIDHKAKVAAPEPGRQRSRGFRAMAVIAVFLYMTAWSLPGVGDQGERPGYLFLFERAVHRYEGSLPAVERKAIPAK
jgi:hypothetical protein